jgi:tetratricopeptide (TPR) repeat protein
MAGMSKSKGSKEAFTSRGRAPSRHQVDFELDFFSRLLESYPDYLDALRVYGNLLTRRGRIKDGLEVDRKLIRLRPKDPVAHYNLACSYCLLQKYDLALQALRKAIELGYRDFAYLRRDRDLDHIKGDPRFNQLLREFGAR